jgi:hypothetical protein
VFVRYHTALRQLPTASPPSPLSLEQLETFVQQAGYRYAVTYDGFPGLENRAALAGKWHGKNCC